MTTLAVCTVVSSPCAECIDRTVSNIDPEAIFKKNFLSGLGSDTEGSASSGIFSLTAK